jgi:nucleoside-diphosphate-sugar epimerase
MKVMVTGAAGFLGFALAKKLAETPTNTVVCVDNFIRGTDDPEFKTLVSQKNIEFHNVDLNSQVDVHTLPDDIDVLYHLAALNGTQNFYERPFEVLRCCTLPTIFLLEKYRTTGRLKRFIYAGTSEAYASTVTKFGWPVPTAEDVPLSIDDIANARWSYGGSKMHGEIATIQGCKSAQIPYSIVRFHNAYGPRMGDKHVIPDFLTRAKAGRYELYGYTDTRSFIYVDDAIRATIAVGESNACIDETVHLGGTTEIDMLTLGKMIMQICHFDGEITCHPSPIGSVPRRAPDTAKLKRLTGFEETWTLTDGIRQTADFYLARSAV